MVNIESKINTYWPELQKEFPGFEKPRVVPGDAIRREARIHHLAYMVDQVDQDPTALYIFIKGNPKAGPCDRDTAVEFYYNLMSAKGTPIPSSFEDEYGVDPHTAADLEVLPRPADRRQQYGNDNIFDEFIREFKQAVEKAQREDADRKFKDKFGFDRNDPDIIDVYPDGEEPAANLGNAIEKAVGNEIGAPKPIMYCVVLHPGFGANELGFDGGRRMDYRGQNRRRLREEDDMIREALGDEYEMDEEDFDEMTKEALQDECDMCGDDNCKDGEICGLKESEDTVTADVLAGVYGDYTDNVIVEIGEPNDDGSVDVETDDGSLHLTKDDFEEVLGVKYLGKGLYSKNGNVNICEKKSEDDLQETEEQIDEILSDEKSDTEKTIDEYERIEDDIEEDDDMLSESVIRHATMLAREIW